MAAYPHEHRLIGTPRRRGQRLKTFGGGYDLKVCDSALSRVRVRKARKLRRFPQLSPRSASYIGSSSARFSRLWLLLVRPPTTF